LNSPQKAKKAAAIMSAAPDAAEAVLGCFQKADIVFIGDIHRLLNEKFFEIENLGRFYDAGLRYILAEGGKEGGSPVYSDEELTRSLPRKYTPKPWNWRRSARKNWGTRNKPGNTGIYGTGQATNTA
jgi:hypothetical protein